MTWELEQDDLKRYPHFDKHISIDEVRNIVTDPQRVRTNAFYPFIKYETSHQPFRDSEARPDKKTREIRYASRRDAYIYSYYRYILTGFYEPELHRLGISDSVIAYRRIPISPNAKSCKCNIDFAKEAFEFVLSTGNCSAVVLDISKYFESLDHVKLNGLWCRMLGVECLPPDHAAVFKNITSYRIVDKDILYARLGFTKKETRRGISRTVYTIPFNKMPTQLCSNKDFRDKITGADGTYDSIINKNPYPYGIPQGSPISDILANMYLIDFDVCVSNYAKNLGGVYRRYSDDIILIIPGDSSTGIEAKEFVKTEIEKHGSQVKIHDRKCSVSYFERGPDKMLAFTHVYGRKSKNGLEYLGFRFDGKRIFLRDGTVSGFFRKISSAVNQEAHTLKARYRGKNSAYLLDHFNLEDFLKKFGRVEDFDSSSGCRDWTFWTYARRAGQVFGRRGLPIYSQIRNYKEFVVQRMQEELSR